MHVHRVLVGKVLSHLLAPLRLWVCCVRDMNRNPVRVLGACRAPVVC